MSYNHFDLKSLQAALGGEIKKGQVLCPGPGHSLRDRSLAVRPKLGGGFIVHSFSNDDWRDCVDFVRGKLGLPAWKPSDDNKPIRISVPKTPPDTKKIDLAKTIWSESVDPLGTPAEEYLGARSLSLPAELAGTVLRFHPATPWWNDAGGLIRIPCLIACFRSIENDTITAVHRIRVDQPERWPKTERKMLGAVAGSAIKLDAVDDGVAIAEGLESGMAARQLGFSPVWCLGSAKTLAPIKGVHELVILGERDANGANRKAAEASALEWRGFKVVLVMPPGNAKDFNDHLMGVR